ncbi:MAG: hypothetical protein C0504_16380 [Candidatus Solibacter sp.]|nr:hypothetical protein [Candidatus Solibacter sp.]
MIVEDNSYSGTTATSDLHRLHQLTDVMFTSFLPQLKTAGYNLPKMYLLMPVATASAVKTIADRLSISEQSYFPVPPIVGHTFLRERDSFEAGLPEALQPLQAVVPTNVSLSERVYKTLEYFHDTYAYKYWESETAIATRNAINKKDVLYGYKNGGYAIATYSNCPNNSMPLLWYPHSESDNSQFIALFSRVERRLEHFSERSDRLADHIEITKRDSNHNLRSYLRGFYEKFLRS